MLGLSLPPPKSTFTGSLLNTQQRPNSAALQAGCSVTQLLSSSSLREPCASSPLIHCCHPVPAPCLCLGCAPCQTTGPSGLCCLALVLICVPVCSPEPQLHCALPQSPAQVRHSTTSVPQTRVWLSQGAPVCLHRPLQAPSKQDPNPPRCSLPPRGGPCPQGPQGTHTSSRRGET